MNKLYPPSIKLIDKTGGNTPNTKKNPKPPIAALPLCVIVENLPPIG